MKLYSQRDSRWARETLGNTTSTIGGYGCTISALGMLAGITPSEVNQRLKSANGYLRDLVIWGKIEEAIPWLEFEWRGYSYDNSKVAQAIEDNGSCLVEVDFDGTERTTGRHWVLYIGNGKMQDPYTGTIEPTSKYPLVKGYSIIKVKENMAEDALQVCLAQHLKLVEEAGKKDTEIATQKIRILQLEKEIRDHDCPIVDIPEPSGDFVINGMTRTYEKDGVKIQENYAIKE